MLHINDLSDDCLCLIFSRLSLSCKLTLHRVCPRWRSLQYSVTCTHKSVTLLIGTGSASRALLADSCLKVPYLDQIEPHNSAPFSEHTTLEMHNLRQNVTCQLMQLLPNVTSVQLCLNQCTVMSYVLELLRFWSPKLKYFSLYCKNTYPITRTRSLTGLLSHFKLLNEHCLSLDYLSIELQGDFKIVQNMRDERGRLNRPIINQLDLTCLAWLKEFRFVSEDPVEILFHSLNSYATERLKKIAIGNKFIFHGRPGLYEGDIFQPIQQIVSKLTLLRDIRSPSEYSKFTSLTSLSIYMCLLSWTEFTTHLSPLKNLIHVKLYVIYYDVLIQSDSTPSYQLVQLPSIRIVQIHLRTQHCALRSRHWGYIFPSLELLELKVDSEGVPPAPEVRAVHLSLLLEPFKLQCGALRRIVTLDKYRHEECVDRKIWEFVGANNWNEVVTE